MKKLISAIAVITAAVTCISGCGVKKTESGDLTEVTMWSSNSHSKVVMESLVSGPLSAALNRTFPEDTKLNSVEIKNGVCYVDMNSRFLDQLDGIAYNVKIYSVVNSLCALEDIDAVQILIDGVVVSTSDEAVDIGQPLEADADVVVKDADTPPVVENQESDE